MSHVATVNLTRTVEETFAVVRPVTMTAEQVATLGAYATLADAATALAAGDAVLRVGVSPSVIEVAATISCAVDGGVIIMTVKIAPPTSLTDTVQEHDQYLVYEPGSSTSERRIWQGKWIVEAAPEAV